MKKCISLLLAIVSLLGIFNLGTTVFAADVISVEYTPVKPFVFYENLDGEWQTGNDGNKYFHYHLYLSGGDKLTLKYSDGTQKEYLREEFTGWYTSADGKETIYPTFEVNQMQDHWVKGINYIPLQLNGKLYDIPVIVKDYDVSSIEFIPNKPKILLEYTNGFDQNFGPIDAQPYYIYSHFQEYNLYTDDKLIINYNDGTKEEYICKYEYVNGDSYRYFVNKNGVRLSRELKYSDTQTKKEWKPDKENFYTLTYVKTSVDIPVTIVKNDIAYIEFTPYKPIVFVENQGGIFEEGYNDMSEKTEKFYRYDLTPYLTHPDSYLTLTYKNGTKVKTYYDKDTGHFCTSDGKELEYSDEFFKLLDMQSVVMPWRVGENKIHVSYKAANTEFTATVINGAPAAPKLKRVYNRPNGITVEWEKEFSSDEYRVYRRAAGEKYWTYIGTTTETSYVDKNVKNNTYYKYTVRGCNVFGFGKFEAGLLTKRIEPAKLISVVNMGNGLSVKWNSVKGATGYIVYRRISESKTWQKIATTKDLSYLDTRVASGYTFTYTVMPVCGKYYGAYDLTGIKTVRLYPPKITSLTKDNDSMTVSWSKSNGANKYRIYRRAAGKSWVYLTTVDSQTFKYTDTSAKHGTYYTYTVKSTYENSMSSYKNGPVIYY